MAVPGIRDDVRGLCGNRSRVVVGRSVRGDRLLGTQRTQEIGLRMALSAQPRGMLWLVLRRALIQLAIGRSLGIAGAFGVGKILQSILIQTSAGDPATLGLVV